MSRVYLDWNATAPIRAEAAARVVEAMSVTGNPSSIHAEGRAARLAIETARREVANLVNAPEIGVIFTSGGTEAIATALTPQWLIGGESVQLARALIGASEHAAVLAGGRFPKEACVVLPVDGDGLIDLSQLEALLTSTPDPVLVAVQLANNETGVLQPIAKIAAHVHAQGGILVCDAVQAAGKVALDIGALGADALILSGHKIGGPQGTGALVLRVQATAPAQALIRGGGQEMGHRAGTEAVAALAGFGVAAGLAATELDEAAARMAALRDRLEAEVLARVPEATILGRAAPRLPNTSLIGLDGASAATLLMALDLSGFAVSSGSACSSGKVKRSHVLDAMGVPRRLAESAIRVSLGRGTSDGDIVRFVEAFETAAKCLYKRANAA
ncbi:cysteine desulfurase [Rhizobiales bacterium GAS191]|nr:cysteine desulfurase [Rhizobiales bacterium GAS191]SEE37130.1 cysteine desulfurase [Rhizobiales bacterium GAS188]